MDKIIGIVGGGQLGKMLLQYCSNLGLTTHVYDPSDDCPCRYLCNRFFKGGFNDRINIIGFGRTCDIITFEIEHIDVGALEHLESIGREVFPNSITLRTIQNKFVQKSFFARRNIPTSNFRMYETIDGILFDLQNNTLQFPFVWKATTQGYDGFGVKIIHNENDLNELTDVECIVEDKIDIDKELSVIISRGKDGTAVAFPPVEMIFDDKTNQVTHVIQPAAIDNDIYKMSIDVAMKVSNELKHTGLLAVELFLTHSREIIVNELAPRPHNSGHLTSEYCCNTSQCEQHIRSIFGLPLAMPEFIKPAIMTNIVGSEGHMGNVRYVGIKTIFENPNTFLHLYGKAETRPNRKMGHFTIVGDNTNDNRNELLACAKKLKNTIKCIV